MPSTCCTDFKAKTDFKRAFMLCPVHPLDCPLLGIQWRNQYFVDKCLPFGLRSSPYFFNLVSDALQWCLGCHFNSWMTSLQAQTASADSSWAINSFQLLCSWGSTEARETSSPDDLPRNQPRLRITVFPKTRWMPCSLHFDNTYSLLRWYPGYQAFYALSHRQVILCH